MNRARAILAAAVLLCLGACTKFSAGCELVVMPRVMPVASSPADGAAYMVRIYAYYITKEDADAGNWKPASYAEAEAGLVTHKISGEVRSRGLVGEQSGDNADGDVSLVVTSSPVLLVAVDPVNRFYAWRTFKYEIPMQRVYIPVRFQLWKWEAPYKDTDWTVVSAAYEETEVE